jgi:hypothetical protein
LAILRALENLDSHTLELVDEALQTIEKAVEELTERKASESKPDHSREWNYMSSVRRENEQKSATNTAPKPRSIFEDVDL